MTNNNIQEVINALTEIRDNSKLTNKDKFYLLQNSIITLNFLSSKELLEINMKN